MKAEVNKPSKFFYVLSFIVFIIGIILFCFSLVTGIKSSLDLINHQVIVPGKSIIELKDPGKYTIYFENKSVIDGKVFESDGIEGLRCTLMKTDTGEFINLQSPSMNSNYSVAGRTGKSIFVFNIDKAGEYELNAWYENGNSNKSVLAIGKGFGMAVTRTSLISTAIMFIFLGTALAIFLTTFKKRREAEIQLKKMKKTTVD